MIAVMTTPASRETARRQKLTARNRAQHKGSFLYESAEWMREAYTVRELSLRQMAMEANCGIRTVARWMEIHGIPTDATRRPRPRKGPDNPRWKGGRPKCPGCGGPKAYYAATCLACRQYAGSRNSNWRGSAVGYGAAHERVKQLRGLASSYQCVHCAAPAEGWAYDHADPNERRESGKRDAGPYSLDPEHYIPLCSGCHTRFDFPRKEHGVPSRYINDGCRCSECREAARMYRWRLRAARSPR
jgi:hypothetical protein